LIAAEQKRPDVAERRCNYTIATRFVDPGSFVFLDETGAKTNMTRLYGRAPGGERCVDDTPSGHVPGVADDDAAERDADGRGDA